MRTTRRSAARVSAEHERFARAVDGGTREVSDHAEDRDLAIVAALRETGEAAGPTRDERDRMRSRVMAEAPAAGADPGDDERVRPLQRPAVASRSRPGHGGRHAKRASLAAEVRGRAVMSAAAALCLIMSLSGISLLLSRDALPGDTLYAFKRSTESAELGLTFGDHSKALKHLEFATARISEIERLAGQADAYGNWGSGTPRFLAALDDFESDTIAGTRLLTRVAVGGDLGVLSSLRGWAQQQGERLGEVRAALPAEAGSSVANSLALLEQVQQRVAALQDRAGCQNVAAAASDHLGPLPAEEACRPGPLNDAASAEPLVPSPTTTTAPATPDSSAVPTTTPAPDEQAQDGAEDGSRDRPRLRDILPDRESQDPPWRTDGEERPWLPEDDSSAQPRPPLVIPLPLLPDVSVAPSPPDGPAPR